jgi:hypothetical protein
VDAARGGHKTLDAEAGQPEFKGLTTGVSRVRAAAPGLSLGPLCRGLSNCQEPLTLHHVLEIDMAPYWIVGFFLLGSAFGLASFRNRHLFSEGPSKPGAGEPDGAGALAMWVCIAAALWPLLVVTGLYGAWHRARRLRR